ncbi:MAG: AmmeMemoRadiSam system radical SAM enzyme [Mariprofundales bacterium]|nr:AmmeMemoRadiSam system radical SAM enzyme [Mariprofundales bacterium]
MNHHARFWHPLADGRIQCDLCPRDCKLHEGQRGLCFVRQHLNGAMELTTYGLSSGFAIDPIEKKPLNHFLPGSKVLSFGATGCNLACKFCQNWDISKTRDFQRLSSAASPEQIATTAKANGCASVAFTYTDPTTFLEFVIDTADGCHAQGIATVAVTAGYIYPEAADLLFSHIDAANVDLKAFSEGFYHKLCAGHLQPVLDTLIRIREQHNTWLELTTLLIPGHNDDPDEIAAMCDWIVEHLGADTPLHLTAFHPDWRMQDTPATPTASLSNARNIAINHGLRYVYTGNVRDIEGGTTICHHCATPLIVRDVYTIRSNLISSDGHCPACSTPIPGVF